MQIHHRMIRDEAKSFDGEVLLSVWRVLVTDCWVLRTSKPRKICIKIIFSKPTSNWTPVTQGEPWVNKEQCNESPTGYVRQVTAESC